ncbi:MAG: homocysteine S-methyltransferase family protein [Prolixibacteraceae bacterium]|nr:homocysteine S-methyltransferase family protein [Prolixibacteraceae bacterium]
MKSLAKEISKGRVFVSDGAWGTFLQQKGLKPGECPEEWNCSHPESVFEIAKSYIDAGADMILTNSFGGNEFKLLPYGLHNKVVELNRAAAEISRRAAGSENYVLGSIGPTGKMILLGDVTYEELYEAFKKQALALEQGGVDALLVETMSDLEEAKAAVTACRDNTKCEVICTMTFEKSGENEFNSMMGVTPTDMVNTMITAGADIIGANCGNGMENMIGITREMRKANANIPILIHANAGAPVYRDGETVFLETPDVTASFIKPLIEAGANIIGGCCGTTPEHIARIVKVVNELK